MKIHGDIKSGNCLKVKWTADALGLSYAWVPVDIMTGESRTAAYLAKFPQAQVPAIELDDGRTLAQSNAIIRYLARGSRLLPDDAFTQAKIDEWLFWEQYSHEPYVGTCRFHMVYLGKSKETRDPAKVERGEKALDHMERMLAAASRAALTAPSPLVGEGRGGGESVLSRSDRPHLLPQSQTSASGIPPHPNPPPQEGRELDRFLVGQSLTIADIALLAYTRVAHEGGFEMSARPNVRKWIARCESALEIS